MMTVFVVCRFRFKFLVLVFNKNKKYGEFFWLNNFSSCLRFLDFVVLFKRRYLYFIKVINIVFIIVFIRYLKGRERFYLIL